MEFIFYTQIAIQLYITYLIIKTLRRVIIALDLYNESHSDEDDSSEKDSL